MTGGPFLNGPPSTTISFRPVRTRFIRITQTGAARNNEMWGIQQIRIYRAGIAPAR